jgi:hypothetical protein
LVKELEVFKEPSLVSRPEKSPLLKNASLQDQALSSIDYGSTSMGISRNWMLGTPQLKEIYGPDSPGNEHGHFNAGHY